MSNSIYDIAGRIKNIIASKDIALSPTGVILVNSYALVLKDLYDYADSLPYSFCQELEKLLLSKEGMPEYVISLSQPKWEQLTLYEEVLESTAIFGSTVEALAHFTEEYKKLGGVDFWREAESVEMLTQDHKKMLRVNRAIQMCLHLIDRERNGS